MGMKFKTKKLAKGELDFKGFAKIVRAEGKSLLKEISDELVRAGALCPMGVERLFPNHSDRPDMDFIAAITVGNKNGVDVSADGSEPKIGLGLTFRIALPTNEDDKWVLWNYSVYSETPGADPLYSRSSELCLADPWLCTFFESKLKEAMADRIEIKQEIMDAIQKHISSLPEAERYLDPGMYFYEGANG